MPVRSKLAELLACLQAGGRNLASSKENTKQLWPYLLPLLELSAEIQYRALDRCIEASFLADLPQQQRSQLLSHLCSFNPIDFTGAKGEEEGSSEPCRPELRSPAQLDLLVLAAPSPGDDTGDFSPWCLVQTPGPNAGMNSSRIKDLTLNQVTGKLDCNPLISFLLLFSLCSMFLQLSWFVPS